MLTKDGRSKLSKLAKITNAKIKSENYKVTVAKLDELNYNFLDSIKSKTLKEISSELKSLGIIHNKLALDILRNKYDKLIIDKIFNIRRTKHIAKTAKYKIENDENYKMQCVKNFQSGSYGRKTRSRGEQKVRSWLKMHYPEYDWGSRHLAYDGEVFEYDIYSKKHQDYFIEYNGIVHNKPIYGLEKFHDIKRKDNLKINIMKELNKKFIVIDDGLNFDKQIEQLKQFLSVV